MTVVLRRALHKTRKETYMIRRLKQMKFKSTVGMNDYICTNHIYERDIHEVEIHDDDITLHYYINIEEVR